MHILLTRVLGAFAVACAGLSAATATAQQPRTLVIARDLDINSLDPARTFCDSCQLYMGAAYERLLAMAPDGKTLQPLLAARWEASPDQTRFTFHLDERAVFNDGSPVRAKDVKWSWERLRNVKSSPAVWTRGIKEIAVEGERTVVVTLAAPDSEFLARTTHAYLAVLNSDQLESQGATAAANADTADKAETWLLRNSAGSGAFMLESYAPREEIRLKRNENYWRTKPAFARVVIRQSKDAVSQAQLLQSGTADLSTQMDIETVKSIVGDKLELRREPSFSFIYLALSPGAKGAEGLLPAPVREAIGLAIDYKTMLDFTLSGAGRLQASPLANGLPGTAGLPEPRQDLARAKELMAASGVKNLELVASFPTMNVNGIDLSQAMQLVQRDLARIGIKVTLRPTTFSVWRDQIVADGIPMTIGFYTPGYAGAVSSIDFFAMTPNSVWGKRAGIARDPSIATPQVTAMLAEAMSKTGAERDAIFGRIAEQMIKDRIIIPLVNADMLIVFRKGLTGVRRSICCQVALEEIGEK